MARAAKAKKEDPAPTGNDEFDGFGAPAEDEDENDGDDLFGALDEDADSMGGKFVVPDGLYAATIVDGAPHVSKTSGEPGIKWTFVLTGEWCGPDGDMELHPCPHKIDTETEWTMYTSFAPAAQFQIPRLVKTFEPYMRVKETPKGKRAHATRDDMLGCRFLVRMKQEEYDDEVSSKPGKIKRHPAGPKDAAA